MIEDKSIGLKIAESEEEALWHKISEEADMLIKQSENNLIVQKAMKEMAEAKLKALRDEKQNPKAD